MNNNHRQTTSYHYAIDAAKLVEKCRSLLHSILDLMESTSSERVFQRRAFQLLTMYDGEFYRILSDIDMSCVHIICFVC